MNGRAEQATQVDKRALAVLSLGHFTIDAYSSIIYPLLPLLVSQLHLTRLEVFFLVPVFSLTSAVLQPVYGFLADHYSRRHSRRLFTIVGPAVIGCFVSFIGVAPNYWLLLACLFIGGIGAGAFHPQSVSLAARASGQWRRMGVAFFSSSGTLGFALGPLLIALLVAATDLSKTIYTFGFGLAASMLISLFHRIEPQRTSVNKEPGTTWTGLIRALKLVWVPLLILYIISLSRAMTQMLIINYAPFILREEGYSVETTGVVLTIFLLTGSLGAFAGGAVAERLSGRKIILVSGVMATLFLAVACSLQGPISIAFMIVGSFALMSIFPVNIVWAQELVPTQTSTVSALLMGFVWGIGSLAAPAAEPLAGAIGFRPVIMAFASLPLLLGLLAFALPRERRSSVHPIHQLASLPAPTAGD